MTVNINAIADAIVEALNDEAAPFRGDFTYEAQRFYLPELLLEQLNDPDADFKILVVPKTSAKATATRGSKRSDVEIDLGILKKVEDTENETLDPLTEMVEAIAEYFLGWKSTDGSDLVCMSANIDPLYIPQHLHQNNQFSSIITLSLTNGLR